MRAIHLVLAILAVGWSNLGHALDPREGLAEYKHVIFRTGDQGLTGHTYSIAQTEEGYLWIGTTAGLFRFDGVRFAEEEGAPMVGRGGAAPSVYRSTDGSLWFSGSGKGLVRLKEREEEVIDSIARVRAITEDEKGTIWYSKSDLQTAREEICSWVLGSKPRCLPSPYHLGTVMCAYAGAIWSGSDTGLIQLRDGKFSYHLIAGLKPHNDGVDALASDGHGGLLVGGPAFGVKRLIDQTLMPVEFGGVEGAQIPAKSLFKDRQGALWIGTQNDGIYRVYDDQVDHFVAADSTKAIFQIIEDQEGSIWLATKAGLESFSDRRVVTVVDDDHFHSDEVDGVSVGKDGTLWVAGWNTLMELRPGSHRFEVPAAIPANTQVTSIFEDHMGGMWIGLNDSLSRLKDGRLIPLKLDTGAPVGMIVSIAEDRTNNLWAVALGPPRRVLKIDPRTFHVTPGPTLPPASRVAADPTDGIYLAALNGDLIHVDSTDRQIVYPHPQGHSERIPQLSVAPDGTAYVSTNFGLEVLRNSKIQVMDTRNGLPCEVLYDTLFDRHENLWLYMQCGLVRISRDDLSKWFSDSSVVVPTILLDAEDGTDALDAPFGGSARTRDGVLWFANSSSLQKFNPEASTGAGRPPPVQIEQFMADGKYYGIDRPIKLPASTGNIQIDYAGLSFVAPDKVRFRYKLDGFDRDWREVGSRREAIYTTLAPASYGFHVIASDSSGVWNDVGADLRFDLAPAFHQTVWFRLLCAMLILGLLWLILKARVRQVAGRVRLKQSIQYSERLRIARQLHDSFLQNMQGLMIRFSSAAKAVPRELPVRRVIDDLLDRSDDIIAEARHSIQDLREREKQTLELAQEISALSQELGSEESVPVTVLTNGEPYELNSDAHENVLLIVREALINSFKHASPRAIEVQVDYRKTEFKLAVRDDGRGIDENVIKLGREGHWGLHGMRERAASIHGKLLILSKIGAGTEIEIVVARVYATIK
ncbi:MAG: integral rane sensor signal transduction histidine kinase [Gammaproteobacteria bacterium]|nr:integral rane sensor signal transduction histidine kinase [Gammaproteobacteria bacterium]